MVLWLYKDIIPEQLIEKKPIYRFSAQADFSVCSLFIIGEMP